MSGDEQSGSTVSRTDSPTLKAGSLEDSSRRIDVATAAITSPYRVGQKSRDGHLSSATFVHTLDVGVPTDAWDSFEAANRSVSGQNPYRPSSSGGANNIGGSKGFSPADRHAFSKAFSRGGWGIASLREPENQQSAAAQAPANEPPPPPPPPRTLEQNGVNRFLEERDRPLLTPHAAVRDAVRDHILKIADDSMIGAIFTCEPIKDQPLLHMTAKLRHLRPGNPPDTSPHDIAVTIKDGPEGKTILSFIGPPILHRDVPAGGISKFNEAAAIPEGKPLVGIILETDFEAFGHGPRLKVKEALVAIGKMFQMFDSKTGKYLVEAIQASAIERANAEVQGLLLPRSEFEPAASRGIAPEAT